MGCSPVPPLTRITGWGGAARGVPCSLEPRVTVARWMGRWIADQVEALVQAAKGDNLGKYAEGAMERVLAGSRDTMDQINAAIAK